MFKTIHPITEMSEDQIKETESEKIRNMCLIYDMGLRGLDHNYVLPHWNIGELEQIREDTYKLEKEARRKETSYMIRSAHYSEGAVTKVSMPVRVDKSTSVEIRKAIIDVVYESREKMKRIGAEDYKLNLIICSCLKGCPRSGMLHVHEDRLEFHSLYGNVAGLHRRGYENDTIITDRSFNVVEKILGNKERMLDIKNGDFVVVNVPKSKQNILSLSDSEILLFEKDISTITDWFPDRDVEAMWLEHEDIIKYSYLDTMDRHKEVKKVKLDEIKDEKWVPYHPDIDFSELAGEIVYIPLYVWNSEQANDAITFLARSKAKVIVLPKRVADCSHRITILREENKPYVFKEE